jgi:UDP-glucuronate 4-epimerase
MSNPAPTILVTGSAGFIGFHLSRRLGQEGYRVVSLDNFNDYYDPKIKLAREAILKEEHGIDIERFDLADLARLEDFFARHRPSFVIHLAAQAGVRYSIDNPHVYIQSNLVGFTNILECCRKDSVQHLLYASSSSVYGSNTKLPFATSDNVDHPISLYAATKKANELMAHTYSHLFKLPTTGLRFFTVYGPWGRPDMALFKFTKAILNDDSIDVYNNGKMRRDFTYVDDVVESVFRLIPLAPDAAESTPYRVLNVGNNSPVQLLDFIHAIEHRLGKTAKMNLMPLQPGDVPETYADVADLVELTGFSPATSVETGIGRFIDWYVDYFRA